MKDAKQIFKNVIDKKKNPTVKLLGDSITHGVGGTGWEMKGEPIVEDFRRSPDSFCWAKLFAERMKDSKLYLDTSSVNKMPIPKLVELCGADRLVYGSDYVVRDPRRELGKIVFSGISEEMTIAVTVLPLPLSPTRPTISPSPTVRSMPRTAS